MPIKLTDLRKSTRTLAVEYEGETANVQYRPSALTPYLQMVLLDWYVGEESADRKYKTTLNDVLDAFTNLVATWDVLDESGKPLPVNRQWVRQMPTQFIATIIGSILEDIRSPKANGAISPAP